MLLLAFLRSLLGAMRANGVLLRGKSAWTTTLCRLAHVPVWETSHVMRNRIASAFQFLDGLNFLYFRSDYRSGSTCALMPQPCSDRLFARSASSSASRTLHRCGVVILSSSLHVTGTATCAPGRARAT